MDIQRFPAVGETVEALRAETEPGGKGYNQAVGATRLGALVNFITAVGDDDFGRDCAKNLAAENVNGIYVTTFPNQMTACGVGLSSADKKCETIVYPGAIRSFGVEDIRKHSIHIENSGILLIQNEISSAALNEAVKIAHNAGVRIIYNPAPARKVARSLLSCVECITPNATEAAILTDADPDTQLDVDLALSKLHAMGAANVIITLGEKGSVVSTADGKTFVRPLKVKAVNTTGAGDSFNAALAVRLMEGDDYLSAARFATVAAGIAVTRSGANRYLPYRREVEAMLEKYCP